MDGSEIVHTEFDAWRTLPPGTNFNYRGIHVGTVVRIETSGNPIYSDYPRRKDASMNKLNIILHQNDPILDCFFVKSVGKKETKLPKRLKDGKFLCWDGVLLNSRIHWTSNFGARREEYEEFYHQLRKWTAIDTPKGSGPGTLLELSKDGKKLAEAGIIHMVRREVRGGGLSARDLTRKACNGALIDKKIKAYTRGHHVGFSDFTLRHVVKDETIGSYGFGVGLLTDLYSAQKFFGKVGPFFWNATTVRLELVYDLITIGYEMDLPGDGSSVAPHTLEKLAEAPVQLPLMLEKVVLTFIRNKEHLGRPLTYRLRRIADDNENQGSGEK